MRPTTIMLVLDGQDDSPGWLQPLAGGHLWCDRNLGLGGVPASPPPVPRLAPPSHELLVYDGPGLVDGGLQRIRSFIDANGARRVEMADGESFRITATGDRIERIALPDRPPAERTVERALGAPLALALAAQGIFVLHASGLVGPRGVAALTTVSGGGKSTLAAAASRQPGLALTRVADDLLPVELSPVPLALPHFPQLKLPTSAGYPPDASATLPLALLAEIVHAPQQAGRRDPEGPHGERLDPTGACLAVVRATVASRLFDRDLLASHFAASAAASKRLEVWRLRYASGLDRLGEPLVWLARHLAA